MPKQAEVNYNLINFCCAEMVRHYKSQHQRAQWTEQSLKDAIAAVETGVSLKKASKDFSIPRTTLRNHLKLKEKGGQFSTKKLGRPTVLSSAQETELVNLILDYESRLFGLTVLDIRRLVYDYCEKNNIKHNFSHTLQCAGEDWARAFIARHPTLSIRKPESVSIFRASGFNKEKVNRFYDVLEPILYNDSVPVVPPENVYNVDESGYTVCNKVHKIVGKKGKKAIGTLSSAERGKTVTAICCVNACGNFVPPMLVFPRVRFKPELIDKAPAGCIGGASKSGWINEYIFNKWFGHFVKFVNPSAKSAPIVLIMDGHSCHVKNLELIDQARSNNVILVSLPSHCTHRLQPLDISFFKSLNTFYDSEIQSWLRQHPGRVVTEFQIGELFNAAYGKAATVQNGSSGFRKAGIYPFRRDLFTEEDFLGAQMTERPLHDVPVASCSTTDNSGTAAESADDVTVVDPAASSHMQSAGDDVQSVSTSNAQKTFSDILNDSIDKTPCNRSGRKKSKRTVAHAAVVTSSPYKTKIEGAQKRKKTKDVSQSCGPNLTKKTKKQKNPATKKKCNSNSPQQDETPCMYCEQKYCHSYVQWIRCGRCKLWACCNCARMGKGKRQYICDSCK